MKPIDILTNNLIKVVGEGYKPLQPQIEALEQILRAVQDGKRWIWISGNIGTGKSSVASAYGLALNRYKIIQAVNIREYSDLTIIKNCEHLLLDDIGKNPIKINHMGDYIEVVPFIMYNRVVPYVTIFTSQHLPDLRIFLDHKAVDDRFKKYGIEIRLTGTSLR